MKICTLSIWHLPNCSSKWNNLYFHQKCNVTMSISPPSNPNWGLPYFFYFCQPDRYEIVTCFHLLSLDYEGVWDFVFHSSVFSVELSIHVFFVYYLIGAIYLFLLIHNSLCNLDTKSWITICYKSLLSVVTVMSFHLWCFMSVFNFNVVKLNSSAISSFFTYAFISRLRQPSQT